MSRPLFCEERADVLHELMRSHPLAALISVASGRLRADHLPLVLHADLSENGILRGHIHKGNPLWRDRSQLDKVMAIFQGPQAYVSPSWYPSKKLHGKVVPTWNYAVVHAHGALSFTTDTDWLQEHLVQLTLHHESQRPEPWALADASEQYIARQLRGIVGVELIIDRLEGIWKVSQNRDELDRAGVQQGLLAENDQDAVAMSGLVSSADNTSR